MNSEELEISLRTEFESYLNGVLAEMRQEVSDFQEKFQTEQAKFQNEFEAHKSRLDEVFRGFSSRLENERQMDEAFRESVTEHLRLAKDEGARITASAIAEAEDREKENSEALAASGSYSEIRDAITDISSQDSQAGILKSLVNHAAQFTPRGAFFIIKNERFVGWRVFGKEGTTSEQNVREIFFPMAGETVLSEAARSLSAVESSYGTYSDDSVYLDKLEFGQPDRMYAIPLIARGRAVAVLYADYGTEGVSVNIEALETLVRVAGLTVELLAASHGARTQTAASQPAQPAQPAPPPQPFAAPPAGSEQQTEDRSYQANNDYNQSYSVGEDYNQTYPVTNDYETPQPVQESYDSSDAETDYVSENHQAVHQETGYGNESQNQTTSENYQNYFQEYGAAGDKSSFQIETPTEHQHSWNDSTGYPGGDETYVVEEVVVEEEETATRGFDNEDRHSSQDYSTASSYDFQSPTDRFSDVSDSFEQKTSESDFSRFEPADNFPEQTFTEQNFDTSRSDVSQGYSPEPFQTASSAPTAPVKTRLSERNVDLPIEVPDEERRFHNDARRFARLLVSEIKLYNEQKVKEGRESGDLYERLREAIDRSREMYEKRVQQPVAAKFDYFNYEVVNSLAEGDESRLGDSYPGKSV